jgi:hypothetical protein
MNDESAGPPPLPETPAPSPETVPPGPVSSSNVALGVVALIGGLLLLIPGGLCSIMAVGMCAGGGEEGQIAWVVGGIGLPALAVGIGLLIFGARRLRRKRSG